MSAHSYGDSPATTRATPNVEMDAAVRQLGKRDVPLHDPSTIVRCGNEYWLFSTGRGVSSFRSTDGVTWRRGPKVFDQVPDWVKQKIPAFKDHFWAPDVIQVGNRFLVYYSVSSWGSRNSAIGLASSPTLDPEDPAFKWTDHGMVVETLGDGDHNAIDASLMLDAEGKLWLSYGSFWGGIKLVELDPKTGLRAKGGPLRAVAWSQSIEAPCIFRRGSDYFLIVNWGFCCRAEKSTYQMRIGRSKSPGGPFLDRSGRDLAKGGGDILLDTEGPFIGPGHAGILEQNGKHWMSMHFYDGTQKGKSTLAIRELSFDKDGWPIVGRGTQRLPQPPGHNE